ncbi:MAG TPA: hypothetical protein VEL49_03800 [Ktedonobacteraceae bacterium]|nr:hypothetical protein [Ktedonobacteraceae bacterium]
MVKELPIFKGYTVDERLKEFRRVIYHEEGPSIEFIPFDSPKGQELLSEMEATILTDEFGEWVCICGNVPSDEGFYPCDEQGNMVEPTPEEWTTKLYRCDRCGRIIDQDTRKVVLQVRS